MKIPELQLDPATVLLSPTTYSAADDRRRTFPGVARSEVKKNAQRNNI